MNGVIALFFLRGALVCLLCPALLWFGLLFACGVGLSLHSYRFIGVAPVRGGTSFLCRRKESKQRKRAQTASL
jgi:hypothetical protein